MIEIILVIPFNAKYFKVFINSIDEDPRLYTYTEIYRILINENPTQLAEFQNLLESFTNFLYYVPTKEIIILTPTVDLKDNLRQTMKKLGEKKKELSRPPVLSKTDTLKNQVKALGKINFFKKLNKH